MEAKFIDMALDPEYFKGGDKLRLFKTSCAVDKRLLRDNESSQQNEDRLQEDILKEISIGFTSSENKLNQLKQGGKSYLDGKISFLWLVNLSSYLCCDRIREV